MEMQPMSAHNRELVSGIARRFKLSVQVSDKLGARPIFRGVQECPTPQDARGLHVRVRPCASVLVCRVHPPVTNVQRSANSRHVIGRRNLDAFNRTLPQSSLHCTYACK